MKLSSLTPQDKIKLAAELDGWCEPLTYPGSLPNYSTSYDAIIPLIQKQDTEVQYKMYDTLVQMGSAYPLLAIIKEKPSFLLDALLVATGKAEL